jgi:hypothetical protein
MMWLCLPLLLAGCSGSRLPRMAVMHAEPEGSIVRIVKDVETIDDQMMELAMPADLRAILEKPERVTLYTLADEEDLEEGGMAEAEMAKLPRLDDYYVMGEATVSSGDGRKLIDSFWKAVNAGSPGSVECFFPHHAIRAEAGGKSVTVLVCFMCDNFKVLPRGAFNTIVIEKDGMEKTWRDIVSTHKLKDVSRASWEEEEEE